MPKAPLLSRLGPDLLYGGLVTLLAGIVRFVRLNIPKSLIPLDEFYYPVNSLGLLRHGADYQLAKGASLPGVCGEIALEPAFAVHPPVAKWLIGAGMKVFGCNSFGWRVSAALLGTATVLLVFLIGRRLFRSAWAAGLAGLLVALDGLFFVQSRIAMLDVFVAFFIVLAIWLLLEDRERAKAGHVGWRPWRLGAGVAIGLGAASKWSAAFVMPFLALLALIWEFGRRRAAQAPVAVAARVEGDSTGTSDPLHASSVVWASPGDDPDNPDPDRDDAQSAVPDEQTESAPEAPMPVPAGPVYPAPIIPPAGEAGPPPLPGEPPPHDLPPPRNPLNRDGWWQPLVKIGATFALVPFAVYVVSYIPWFASGNVTKDGGTTASARYIPPRCVASQEDAKASPVVRQAKVWLCYQREIYDFHKNLKTLDDKGKPSHPYLSRAWSWAWMGRPTSHYFDTKGHDEPCEEKPAQAVRAAGEIRRAQAEPPPAPSPSPSPSPTPVDPTRRCKTHAEILGLPNPAMWFPAFWVAIPLLTWWAIKRRDPVSQTLLILFTLPLFAVWLLTTRPLFLFYMTPAVPLLALMVAHLVHRTATRLKPWQQTAVFGLLLSTWLTPLLLQWTLDGETKTLAYKIPVIGILLLAGAGLGSLFAYSSKPSRFALMYAGVIVLLFAYFYPVTAAVHIPDDGMFGWRNHMWLQHDCGKQQILLNCWI